MKKKIIDLISEIKDEIKLAFEKQPIDRNDFVEIITKIHSLKFSDRIHFKEIYERLGDDLDERSIILSEYNPELFQENEQTIKKKTLKEKVDVENLFESKLRIIGESIKDANKFLRRYILLKLKSEDSNAIQILLLHDRYSNIPIFKVLKQRFKDDCINIDIEDFVSRLKNKENDYRQASYVCLLVLSPGIISAKEIQKLIEDISTHFTLKKIKIDVENLTENNFFDLDGNKEDIVDELQYIIGIELLNDSLPNEISNLLRKNFKDRGCHTLSYTTLSGGFSGSTVFEVIAHSELGESDRFVIKVGEKRKKSINEELKNHRINVELYDSKTYQIKYVESDNYLAIQYTYASSDSIKESKPFSKVYYELTDAQLRDIITQLFSIKLIRKWDTNIEHDKYRIAELYENYIKKEDLFKSIIKISSEERNILIDNVNKIFKYKIDTSKKVCHGDLHTDNLFYDGQYVFLIDFGHTKKCHTLIDHTTLECAIKFRLIPFYIPIENLQEIEKELLIPETFNADYSFKDIQRDDLYKPFKIINQIRSLAKPLFLKGENPIEYLISLLMITLRQIPYPDINQLYALTSAKILSEHIITRLKL